MAPGFGQVEEVIGQFHHEPRDFLSRQAVAEQFRLDAFKPRRIGHGEFRKGRRERRVKPVSRR